jgi:hypothetical protein
VYVEPSQILLLAGGNLLFTYQTAHGLILICGSIRKEVRDYKLDSYQLICMKRFFYKGQRKTTNDTKLQRRTWMTILNNEEWVNDNNEWTNDNIG